MAVLDRYSSRDREAVAALYRRVIGPDALDALQLRWQWEHRRNPSVVRGEVPAWVAREGPAVVGHCATVPVRLHVRGQEVDAAWLSDLLVAPERRRQGLADQLCGTWDRSVGAALGLGLPDALAAVVGRLGWHEVGVVPSLVKPLSRRAFRQASWSPSLNRVVSAIALPVVKSVARLRPLADEVAPIRRFDASFSALWEELTPRFDLAVRRDESYLNWRFRLAPHVRYSVGSLVRRGKPAGYVVCRHVQEARSRITLLVDFLTAPDDERGLATLLRWVDREALAADSDKIRCSCLHRGFRRILKRNGYFASRSRTGLFTRINAPSVPASFHRRPDRWHITMGDSDLDR
jgi:GNAT superfamily N-acetyltransferase